MVNASDRFFNIPAEKVRPFNQSEHLRCSNGLTVSIFPRFLSTLPDVFTLLLEKMCEILGYIP